MDNQNSFAEKINKKLEKGLETQSKSITGFFIRNYRFTYLITAAIIGKPKAWTYVGWVALFSTLSGLWEY